MKAHRGIFIGAGLLLVLVYQVVQARQAGTNQTPAQRGKYLVEITGCNDCHTAGYAEAGGKTPESDWLKGDTLGFRGPWGTTYATNLRLSIGKMTEDQWLKYARGLMTRPPMPWFNVRAMNDADLRSIYQYIRSIGVSGNPAPAFVPPDKAPNPPYVQWPGVK